MAKSVRLRYKTEKDNKVQRTFYYTQKKDIEDTYVRTYYIQRQRHSDEQQE